MSPSSAPAAAQPFSDPKESSKLPTAKWLVFAVTAVCIIAIASAALFGWLLLTLPPGGDSDTKVVVAVLGLLGVLVTATMSVGGFVLKQSLDWNTLRLHHEAEARLQQEAKHNQRLAEQTEQRLQIEAEHNRQLVTQAEGRLKLQAAIEALRMLTTTSGAPAPEFQVAGALFALVSLNQLDLALTLLENLWSKDKIDAGSAVSLVNRGLLAGGDEEKTAVNILRDNIHKVLYENGGYHWPDCVAAWWNPDLSVYARERLLGLILRVTVLRKREEWDEVYLASVFVSMYACVKHDKEPRIRKAAALALQVLRQALNYDPDRVLYPSRQEVRIAEVLQFENEWVSAELSVPRSLLERIEKLKSWAGLGETAGSTASTVPESPGESPA